MVQAPVVQTLDSAIHRINLYPADKYWGNQLHYPLDRDLSSGYRYPAFEQLRPEGLWKGVKETIVFVFGGRYICVHSIIVLDNFPN